MGHFGGLAAANDKIRDMGTVRGRIGYAYRFQVLIYGTGGYAWADNRITATASRREASRTATSTPAGPPAPASRSCSHRDGRSRPSTSIAAFEGETYFAGIAPARR